MKLNIDRRFAARSNNIKMSSEDANRVAQDANRDAQQVAIDIAPQVEMTPVQVLEKQSTFSRLSTWGTLTAGLNQVALMDMGGGLEKTSVIPGREVEDQLAELLRPPEESTKRPIDKVYLNSSLHSPIISPMSSPSLCVHPSLTTFPLTRKIAALVKNKVVLIPKKTGPGSDYHDLDVGKKEQLVKMVMEDGGMDNLVMMRKISDRYEAMGVKPPGVEVRFEHLKVTADVLVGSRGMPGLANDVRAMLDNLASPLMKLVGAKKEEKRHLVLLDSISGVLKPGRLTLLLGPPGAGKSTLLRSLAGQLKGRVHSCRIQL